MTLIFNDENKRAGAHSASLTRTHAASAVRRRAPSKQRFAVLLLDSGYIWGRFSDVFERCSVGYFWTVLHEIWQLHHHKSRVCFFFFEKTDPLEICEKIWHQWEIFFKTNLPMRSQQEFLLKKTFFIKTKACFLKLRLFLNWKTFLMTFVFLFKIH